MKPIPFLIPCLLALAVAGCGNKGPLVMPGAPLDAPPPADVPASAEPVPEALNDAGAQPPQGEGSEGGDAATPPVKPPR